MSSQRRKLLRKQERDFEQLVMQVRMENRVRRAQRRSFRRAVVLTICTVLVGYGVYLGLIA